MLSSMKTHAVVKPIPQDSPKCLSREAWLIEEANHELRVAIYKAHLHGNYPGPCEARCIMHDIQKARCEVYAKRMTAENRKLISIEYDNRKMMNKIKEMSHGKVDCHWTPKDIDYFEQTRAHLIKKKEKAQAEVNRHIRAMEGCYEKNPESKYSRENLECDWKGTVKALYNKTTRYPCSDWWHEYLEQVAGDNPQRRPPTRPRFCCRNRLEGLEEREFDRISRDLFRINRKQQDEEQQEKQLELKALYHQQL